MLPSIQTGNGDRSKNAQSLRLLDQSLTRFQKTVSTIAPVANPLELLTMQQVLNQSTDRAANSSYHNLPDSPSFNFELWAKQLRPQLLAALNKRKQNHC
ncbi:hypothetical protein H6F89_24015 [Cyanobacteria bacterium FACHB-63]|nr:hypothetical protein [Cyanobacteria bacterium FACHB-63]